MKKPLYYAKNGTEAVAEYLRKIDGLYSSNQSAADELLWFHACPVDDAIKTMAATTSRGASTVPQINRLPVRVNGQVQSQQGKQEENKVIRSSSVPYSSKRDKLPTNAKENEVMSMHRDGAQREQERVVRKSRFGTGATSHGKRHLKTHNSRDCPRKQAQRRTINPGSFNNIVRTSTYMNRHTDSENGNRCVIFTKSITFND